MEINIIGLGIMGAQINALFNLAGIKTFIWDKNEVSEKSLDREFKKLKKQFSDYDNSINYTLVDELEKLPNNPTIEVVIENLDVKKEIYYKIRAKNNKAYFSNTSSYCPSDINEDINSLHFFNPINMGLVEYYICDDKYLSQWSEIKNILEELRFSLVEVKSNRGYIGNYVLFSEISTYFRMIEKYGYSTENLNIVIEKLYGERDIIKIIDLIGIDVVCKILKNLNEQDEFIYVPKILDEAISKNILGRKNKTTISSLLIGENNV